MAAKIAVSHWGAPAIFPRNHGFSSDIEGQPIFRQRASLCAQEFEQKRDVGPLHEAIMRGRPPEIGRQFDHAQAVARDQGTDNVVTVNTSRRRCSASLCLTCQSITGGTSLVVRVRNTAAPHARNVLLDERGEKRIYGHDAVVQLLIHRIRTTMPDQHDRIDSVASSNGT